MDWMAEPPNVAKPQDEAIAEQLAKTAADLRTLGEQLGAISHTAPKEISLRRAKVTFLVAVASAALVGWFLWDHWHSLVVAFAPLIWIVGHSLRWRRSVRPRNEQP